MSIGNYNVIFQDTINRICVGESNIRGGGHVPPVPPFLHLYRVSLCSPLPSSLVTILFVYCVQFSVKCASSMTEN